MRDIDECDAKKFMFSIDGEDIPPVIVGVNTDHSFRSGCAVFTGIDKGSSYVIRAYYDDHEQWVEADRVKVFPSMQAQIIEFVGPLSTSYQTKPTSDIVAPALNPVIVGQTVTP